MYRVPVQTPEPPTAAWKTKAEGMGLSTKEGTFGFTPFSEMWVGRAAMMGFLSGCTVELITGHPILEQVRARLLARVTFSNQAVRHVGVPLGEVDKEGEIGVSVSGLCQSDPVSTVPRCSLSKTRY